MTSPRLLKENAESLSQGLSWTFLSKTFQHALGIARAAGFRYMWIDSLCIIQDDPDDLRHEIQHMGDIDSNATLSIFALQPGKCFTRRVSKNRGTISGKPPTPRLRYQAKTSSERSNSYEVFACLAVDDDRYWKPKPYDHTFDNQSEKGSFYLPSTSSELFSRGWVFQEWLLGRRALIFGELELGLSCPHGHTSETRGFKLDEEFDLSLSGGMKRFVGVHNALTHADRGHDSWHRIASCYGSTEVNVSAYRTLAIEGLARRFRPDFARAYFAGCWLDYLPNDLLWFPATENVEYGAGLYSEFRTFSSAQTIDPPYISSECLPRNSHMVMHSVLRPKRKMPFYCTDTIKAEFKMGTVWEQDTHRTQGLKVSGPALRTTLGRLAHDQRPIVITLDPIRRESQSDDDSDVICLVTRRQFTMEPKRVYSGADLARVREHYTMEYIVCEMIA